MKKDNKISDEYKGKGVFYSPWEKSFDKILTPFEEFIHQQTTSGLLLMATAIVALILANGPFAADYTHFMHTPVSLGIGSWNLQMTLHRLITD